MPRTKNVSAPGGGDDENPPRPFRQVKGKTVYLEQDSTDKDGKDRLLRYVWLPREGKKAQFIDERMVADGFATFKPRDDNGRRDERILAKSVVGGAGAVWVETSPTLPSGTSSSSTT